MTAIALFPSGAHGFVPSRSPSSRQAAAPQDAVSGCERDDAELHRIAIVVPAQGDAQALCRTLQSLVMETVWDAQCQVVVVTADAASADVAQRAGVQVVACTDTPASGLAALTTLQAQGDSDWFIVVAAGTEVAPGFLEAMRLAMVGGECDALQGRLDGGGALFAGPVQGNGLALSRRALQRLAAGASGRLQAWPNRRRLLAAGLRSAGVDDAQLVAHAPRGAASQLGVLALQAARALVRTVTLGSTAVAQAPWSRRTG